MNRRKPLEKNVQLHNSGDCLRYCVAQHDERDFLRFVPKQDKVVGNVIGHRTTGCFRGRMCSRVPIIYMRSWTPLP